MSGHAPPAAVAPAAGPDSGGVGPAPSDRVDRVVRVASHIAAEVPLAVLGAVELARGWRPLYDNADLALRSWQVFSAHLPLVGHQMAVSVGSHAVFGPGPVQDWLLAVPVRLDPARGVLWGSLLAVLAAVALTVEGVRAAAGWRGASVAAGAVVVLGLARTDLPLDVAWNVWFGLYFLLAALGTGLAAATGRLRWWPVTVVAATVVVQCQAAFAPPAVAVCLAAPGLGVLARRRTGRPAGGRWLAAGVAAGAVLWVAPAVQEAVARPGNLTLLARAARDSGATLGWSAALHALGRATSVPPGWVHPLPPPGAPLFFAIVGTFDGPAWWGVTVLVLLGVVGVVAWRSGRQALGATAVLTLALAVGTVAAIGAVPSAQFLVVGYLGALWVPVGTAVWITFAWALGEVVVAVVGARRPGAGHGSAADGAAWERPVAVGVVLLLAAGSVGVVWRGLDRMDGLQPTLSGWATVRVTEEAATAAARVAPHGPFRLQVVGTDATTGLAVGSGVAYDLATRGLDARPDPTVAHATFGTPPPGAPTVEVTVSGGGGPVTARLVP